MDHPEAAWQEVIIVGPFQDAFAVPFGFFIFAGPSCF
jgi:hypothetical protein